MDADLHITLPPELKEWVDRTAASEGFKGAGDFVRAIIRREQEFQWRTAIDDQLESALKTESVPMTQADWDKIEASVRRRFELRNAE